MAEPCCYTLSNEDDPVALGAAMADLFDGIREVPSTDGFEIMDSFDWRLYKTGRMLIKTTQGFETIDILTGQTLDTYRLTSKKPLAFHWDFPASPLAAMLEEVLEMRALISWGQVERQTIDHELLNSDEKIVVRLVLESLSLDGGPERIAHCRIVPVRGYAKAAKRAATGLKQMDLKPAKQSPILTLLKINGFSPGSYSSKINIDLSPDLPTAEAVRRIMEQLITVMHQNLPGVREDIDSEFLHDFRVSVRRARSLLSQVKGALDAQTTADLQSRLKTMGGITGNVRDLDVYLLKQAEYTALVGDVLKPGIAQLFSTLKRKRRYAKDRMIKLMAGDDFASSMETLDGFVRSDPMAAPDAPETNAPAGARRIGATAREVIYKRYRRIIKKGSRITDATPDEVLHNLRIDCKKLRYLLEFFTSLFPKDQMKLLIKQLKQLQENLGDFNDLSVQQEFLVDYLQGIKASSSQGPMLAATIGGLIVRLGIEHQRVRSQFLSVFARFNSTENRKRFKTLFS